MLAELPSISTLEFSDAAASRIDTTIQLGFEKIGSHGLFVDRMILGLIILKCVSF